MGNRGKFDPRPDIPDYDRIWYTYIDGNALEGVVRSRTRSSEVRFVALGFNPAHDVSPDTSRMKTASHISFRQRETGQTFGSYCEGASKPQ